MEPGSDKDALDMKDVVGVVVEWFLSVSFRPFLRSCSSLCANRSSSINLQVDTCNELALVTP